MLTQFSYFIRNCQACQRENSQPKYQLQNEREADPLNKNPPLQVKWRAVVVERFKLFVPLDSQRHRIPLFPLKLLVHLLPLQTRPMVPHGYGCRVGHWSSHSLSTLRESSVHTSIRSNQAFLGRIFSYRPRW